MVPRAPLLLSALATAAVLGYYGAPFAIKSADKRVLLPGRTTPGHRLIESECAACHTPWGGVSNESCLRCHEERLTAAEDSHPESLVADPRNADRVAGLDARACVTCHREHDPSRAGPSGVTIPADFCRACHEDIAHERPSHQSFSFESCAGAGCHRYHDNRGLYEGFLARHLGEPEVLSPARVRERTSKGGHANAGVECYGCHGVTEAASGMMEWSDHPGSTSCHDCHAEEADSFGEGKHGMRTAAHLSPLTPSMALLPMKPEAHGREMTCNTCHAAHDYDTRRAAVEACLGCHDDKHSKAYLASRHYLLWQKEVSGKGEPGSGVSCATCHMPRRVKRVNGADVITVDHDQNATLRPADKMVRAVCLDCHGLGFSLDALADRDLGDRNYNGRPSVHVDSLSMVERRLDEAKEKP